MRDLKYIIKRVIIGVAIVLVLSCINGCKVKALGPNVADIQLIKNIYFNFNCEIIEDSDSINNNVSNGYGLYYSPSLNRYYLAYDSRRTNTTQVNNHYLNNADSLPYISILLYQQPGSSLCDVKFNFTASPIYYNATDYINGDSIYPGAGYIKESGYDAYASVGVGSTFNMNNNSHSITSYKTVSFNSDFNMNLALINNNTNRKLIYTNYNAKDLTTNTVFHQRNIEWNPVLPAETPYFVSFNAEKKVNNKILMGYTFEPEFSNFDTSNYVYQYKVGSNSTTWLGLSQNKQSIDINSNTILYVRVKDLQDNIIDSATFTVTGIGNFNNSQNIEYDIKFTGEYRTEGNLQGQQSGGSAIIDEYQIYTDFIPNSSILKYQYQWVPINSSLDSNSWVDITLSPTDYGDFTYVVDENGVFYARILDSNNNLKYSATFTVNTIGKLAIDSGNDKITNKFMSISNKLNIGGPISGIIEVPLKVINIIGTGLAGGLTCNDYQLGELMGTNLVIPCVNIRQHLGDSLYNTIDIIISCVMIYNIYKMIMTMYTNFIFMQKNPVKELGNRGD